MSIRKKTYRMKGGAIVYVLLLSSLISALFAGLLLISSYQRLLQNRLYYDALVRENLSSGLELLLHDENPKGGNFAIQLYDTTDDSLYARIEHWGLFSLVHLEAKHKQARAYKSALLGEAIPQNQNYSLYLQDQRQPLSLAGKASIKGRAFLPKAGIRTGYFAGQGFHGSFPQEVEESRSTQQPLRYGRAANFIRSGLREAGRGKMPAEHFSLQEVFQKIPWTEKAFEYRSPYNIRLENSSLHGKSIFRSLGAIHVYPGTEIQGGILFAKEIRIKAGFTGNLQAFATEKIIVEKGAKLSYPSVLFLGNTNQPANLILEEGAELEGALIFDKDFMGAELSREDYVKISNQAIVRGNVYASHHLDIRGKVSGSVYTGSFLLRTPASAYRNHLLDGELDFESLSPSYKAPLIYGSKDLRLIRFLAPIIRKEEVSL